jgi:hypothetical protein
MVLSIMLFLDETSETSVRYVEKTGGKPPVIGAIEIERWALPEQVPAELRVTLEFPREVRAAREGLGATTPAVTATSRASLSTGDKVSIVKNSVTGTKYPPEWLVQYLGKTGVVLWTTPEGAMVQLAGGATWFPYAELKPEA